jgi:hypothetical protein
MHSWLPNSKALFVTVVSNNQTTLRELETYLSGAGVVVQGTRLIDRVLEMTPPSSTAVVMFPDGYRIEAVEKALTALHSQRPSVLAVLVTNDPRRFGHPSALDSEQALVIPKPAWAWTILDTVRARSDSDPVPRASS